jgi:hypothetical protein
MADGDVTEPAADSDPILSEGQPSDGGRGDNDIRSRFAGGRLSGLSFRLAPAAEPGDKMPSSGMEDLVGALG